LLKNIWADPFFFLQQVPALPHQPYTQAEAEAARHGQVGYVLNRYSPGAGRQAGYECREHEQEGGDEHQAADGLAHGRIAGDETPPGTQVIPQRGPRLGWLFSASLPQPGGQLGARPRSQREQRHKLAASSRSCGTVWGIREPSAEVVNWAMTERRKLLA
jgi:hypothetical protein